MAGYIFGIGMIALAIWRHTKFETLPEHGVRLHAVVTGEAAKHSRLRRGWQPGGKRHMLYAPQATYVDPQTREQALYEPDAFSSHRYEVGQQIELFHDPTEGRTWHPSPHRWRETFVLVAFGVLLIVAQFFSA